LLGFDLTIPRLRERFEKKATEQLREYETFGGFKLFRKFVFEGRALYWPSKPSPHSLTIIFHGQNKSYYVPEFIVATLIGI
jgi:hypothetical protein